MLLRSGMLPELGPSVRENEERLILEGWTGLDVLNAVGTDLQGLLEVGVDAGLVN